MFSYSSLYRPFSLIIPRCWIYEAVSIIMCHMCTCVYVSICVYLYTHTRALFTCTHTTFLKVAKSKVSKCQNWGCLCNLNWAPLCLCIVMQTLNTKSRAICFPEQCCFIHYMLLTLRSSFLISYFLLIIQRVSLHLIYCMFSNVALNTKLLISSEVSLWCSSLLCLSALQILIIWLSLHLRDMKGILLSPFYEWGNWGTERLGSQVSNLRGLESDFVSECLALYSVVYIQSTALHDFNCNGECSELLQPDTKSGT